MVVLRIYTLVAVRGKLYRAYIYARGSKRVKQSYVIYCNIGSNGLYVL